MEEKSADITMQYIKADEAKELLSCNEYVFSDAGRSIVIENGYIPAY